MASALFKAVAIFFIFVGSFRSRSPSHLQLRKEPGRTATAAPSISTPRDRAAEAHGHVAQLELLLNGSW